MLNLRLVSSSSPARLPGDRLQGKITSVALASGSAVGTNHLLWSYTIRST